MEQGDKIQHISYTKTNKTRILYCLLQCHHNIMKKRYTPQYLPDIDEKCR